MKRFFEYFLAKWLFLVTVFLLYMPAFAYDMRQNTNDMAYHFLVVMMFSYCPMQKNRLTNTKRETNMCILSPITLLATIAVAILIGHFIETMREAEKKQEQ